MNLITNDADLNKEIASIKVAGRKLDARIQIAALSAITVLAKNGNVHFVNALYLALGKGARHVAMTAWMLQFGGVSANEGESKGLKPFNYDKSKQVDVEGGAKMPWYDMKPSPKPDEVMDVLALTMALLKKVSKPKEGQQVAHGEMIEKLTALCAEHANDEEVTEATEGQE